MNFQRSIVLLRRLEESPSETRILLAHLPEEVNAFTPVDPWVVGLFSYIDL